MEKYLIRPQHKDADAYQNDTWKSLNILNIYRFGISSLLLGLTISGYLFLPLAATDAALFVLVSSLYFATSILAGLLIHLRLPRFTIQVFSAILIDIAAISLLMHASGGAGSGLGMLLIVPIAAGSIIIAGRTALLFAAIASMAMMLEHYMTILDNKLDSSNFIQPGLLGLAFFTTAGLGKILANRIRESETLARLRGVDLANMSELTEHILERMQTGIIVLDTNSRVRLMNESAWYMLGMPATGKTPIIDIVAPELAERIAEWRNNHDLPPRVLQLNQHHTDVMPRFAQILQEAESGAVLIFLEDTAAMAQRAQQLKLASLGRLTASIAHEIRNPLGAISHAGQLLEESDYLQTNDKRLITIISEHTSRVNTIIENILQLSRRDHTTPEIFALKPFIEDFIDEFVQTQSIEKSLFSLAIDPADVKIRFDLSQLRQILSNLCENGIRHGNTLQNKLKLLLVGGITDDFKRPFLDVIDSGRGIEPDIAQHVFEPFYTTSTQGTGLGLYLSRELAESNQAHLSYIAIPSGGSCFRLTFQDPRKYIS